MSYGSFSYPMILTQNIDTPILRVSSPTGKYYFRMKQKWWTGTYIMLENNKLIVR